MSDTLSLAAIRMDGDTQAREALDIMAVRDYAEAMERGDAFPPIIVYYDGETYWLADGFHRMQAAVQAGQETIDATVHEGGQREARLHAAGANATHGLRRTNADKRKAVLTLLHDDEWRQWGDREIARHCAVDGKTVGRLRQDVTAEIRSEPERPRAGDPANDDAKRTYRTRHGTVATMDTARIGATKAPQPKTSTPMERTRETHEDGATVPPPRVQPAAVLSASPPVSPLVAVAPPAEQSAPASPTDGEESATRLPERPARDHEAAPLPEAQLHVEQLQQPAPPLPHPSPSVSVVPAEAPLRTPSLVDVWERAGEGDRLHFVATYRTQLRKRLGELDILEHRAPALPPDIQPTSQSGIILQAVLTAVEPLSPEELRALPGLNGRDLVRNLTRLSDTGRIERTADGRYIPIDDRTTFKNAYTTVGEGRGFVRIHRLREHLGWSRARFDRVLNGLSTSHTIEFHGGDPSRMTEDELYDSYQDEHGTLMLTMSWRA